MKLGFDPEFVEWLKEWNREFDWDRGNVGKTKKHNMTTAAIERIFDLPIYIAGRILESLEEPRWLLLGEVDDNGWAIVATTRDKKLRVISCRRQRKKEVEFYENLKREGEDL